METEIPFTATVDAPPAPDAASFVTRFRTRARRAVEAARRDGPGASRLLRRSVASYAGEAWSHGLSEAEFVDIVHREIRVNLTSRVSTEQLAVLLDAAMEGAMDGYDTHHRVDQLRRVRAYEDVVGRPGLWGDEGRDSSRDVLGY